MTNDTITYSRPIVTLEEARAKGLMRYFTGKPCKHGHICERYTSGCSCYECQNATSPERKASDAVSHRRRRECPEHRAAEMERHRQYYAKPGNDERNSERARDRYKKNPESARAREQNRRALILAADGSHTAADIRRIYADQKGKCACCRKIVGERYHIDHIMPLTLGGSNWPSNLQVLCPNCNLRKSNKHPADFHRDLGMLL